MARPQRRAMSSLPIDLGAGVWFAVPGEPSCRLPSEVVNTCATQIFSNS
jgi:hypothetical protein